MLILILFLFVSLFCETGLLCYPEPWPSWALFVNQAGPRFTELCLPLPPVLILYCLVGCTIVRKHRDGDHKADLTKMLSKMDPCRDGRTQACNKGTVCCLLMEQGSWRRCQSWEQSTSASRGRGCGEEERFGGKDKNVEASFFLCLCGPTWLQELQFSQFSQQQGKRKRKEGEKKDQEWMFPVSYFLSFFSYEDLLSFLLCVSVWICA